MRDRTSPPWWWKPWTGPIDAVKDWWHREREVKMRPAARRDRFAQWVCNLALRHIATPWYRTRIDGAIRYGLMAAARDETTGSARPASMMQPVDFDPAPDERVRRARMRPVSEADDEW